MLYFLDGTNIAYFIFYFAVDGAGMKNAPIFIKIQRPEGYEDTHPDICVDDFLQSPFAKVWQPQVVPSYDALLTQAEEMAKTMTHVKSRLTESKETDLGMLGLYENIRDALKTWSKFIKREVQ